MKLWNYVLAGLCLTTVGSALEEGFESYPAGAFTSLTTQEGSFKADPNHAEIIGKAKSGKQSLRLMGGEGKKVEFVFKKPLAKESELSAVAERWTGKDPFSFEIMAVTPAGEKRIFESTKMKHGSFTNEIEAKIPAQTSALYFLSKTPEGTGLMLDNLSILPPLPMKIETTGSKTVVIPVIKGLKFNPVLRVDVETKGSLNPQVLEEVYLDFSGTNALSDVAAVSLVAGEENPAKVPSEEKLEKEKLVFKGALPASGKVVLKGKLPLKAGKNFFWVNVSASDKASLDNKIAVKAVGMSINKKRSPLKASESSLSRIGTLVANPGDKVVTNNRISKFYRIPGMVVSKKGTLIAVYDLRYHHAGDLPADVDVGVRRSTDGGNTWSPTEIAMTCKEIAPKDPNLNGDGCGDPAILVDNKTGRIWIAALWSHGPRSLWGSIAGSNGIKDCGQYVLAYSDDDGKTWSKPINITEQVKELPWALIFQGPGNGICTKDGTLVFASQFWREDSEQKNRHGHACLVYSKDGGKTWKTSKECQNNTSEAQVVELADGSLMINSRNESRRGGRVVYVTKDLGETWEEHATNENKNGTGLIEPGACQGSIIKVDNVPAAKDVLFFSNPDSRGSRSNMTLKVSHDQGKSWKDDSFFPYDDRTGAGYSSLSPVDEKRIGVLYEGSNGFLYFLRFPYKEILAPKK